jgi:hypothetical protein
MNNATKEGKYAYSRKDCAADPGKQPLLLGQEGDHAYAWFG